MSTTKRKTSVKKVLKYPEGGLTDAGRQHYAATEGANLKPGVKGPADTREKMKRKGSFLRRHFANPPNSDHCSASRQGLPGVLGRSCP